MPHEIRPYAAYYATFEGKQFMLANFFSKILKTKSCWIWKGATLNGYGVFAISGKKRLVHRISWVIHRGEIAEGLLVCHDCPNGDNKLCVNPEHMFLGTGLDNQRDAVIKGVHAKGETNGRSKLTESDVIAIRDLWESGVMQKEISEFYSVTRQTVNRIAERRGWTHVQ